VLRKWKAAIEPERPKSDKPILRDSVVNLSEEGAAKDREIADLKTHIAELEAARETAADTTSIVGALNVLVGSKVGLDDVLPGAFDPVALIDLAKDLNDIAAELKRRAKAKSRGSASVTEGGR
jgi:hypothetical protein